jgi:hypothetical protein
LTHVHVLVLAKRHERFGAYRKDYVPQRDGGEVPLTG